MPIRTQPAFRWFSRRCGVVETAQFRQNRRPPGGVRLGMTARITGSLVVCAAAAAFSAGALIVNAADDPAPVAAAPAPTAAGGAAAITIKDFAFSPATVRPGATLTVTNRDGVSHTVTADAKAFNSGTVKSGAAVALRAPAAPGTYTFFCAIHPDMKGMLVVK
jgi:plastocyanin